ncbi:hypothetical protein Pcinc_030688 [Petrolisthes cinctipes]|uniref:Uncharacterized protein n=1 Tax=Petrolisthes cinctipes TaxID=88211 RepID=A0AAE1EYS6_PETCI|nr:hypothetical protein Pcinc_030688 [Petrolisthes cinctipes]
MLGSVDASDSYPEVNGTSDICVYDVRDATYVMKCILEQNLVIFSTVTSWLWTPSPEPSGNAARMIADGCFTRNIQQRYASYKTGFGERVDRSGVTLEECEDHVRKSGEPTNAHRTGRTRQQHVQLLCVSANHHKKVDDDDDERW